MEVIQLSFPLEKSDVIPESIVLALGFFDGVHLGHQAVLTRAVKEAKIRGVKSAVITFNEHPKLAYMATPPQNMTYLTSNQRKEILFESLDLDIVYFVHFSEAFGKQTPQDFVNEYIVGLNAKAVVAGFDYTYGKPDVANMQTLPYHAQQRFDVIEITRQESEYVSKVSTSQIKQWLSTGELAHANEHLGYAYRNHGRVVHGQKVGRTLGFPTANIEVERCEMLPAVGVYAVKLFVNNHWHEGMASVGYNVTFERDTGLTCEVNIFDFDEDIYGKNVIVEWHHYLRDEIKFNGVDDLIHQLQKDDTTSREYFRKLER